MRRRLFATRTCGRSRPRLESSRSPALRGRERSSGGRGRSAPARARVTTALEVGLAGRPDEELIEYADREGRIVLTHDRDFASLWWKQSPVGIVYLRPGHIRAEMVIELLAAVDAYPRELSPPFLMTAERRKERLRVACRTSADRMLADRRRGPSEE